MFESFEPLKSMKERYSITKAQQVHWATKKWSGVKYRGPILHEQVYQQLLDNIPPRICGTNSRKMRK